MDESVLRPVRAPAINVRPVNDLCVDCNLLINPKQDRQELAYDREGNSRRRCGACIRKREMTWR